jgi:uncharacterized protein (DUF1499 family)
MRRFAVTAVALAVIAIAMLAAAGPLYRLGAALPTAFSFLRYGAYVGGAAAAVSLIAAGLAYRRGARLDVALSTFAFIVALVAVLVPYSWQRRAQTVPPIHDITTDLENPPMFEAIVPLRKDAPNSLERPPVLAEQQRKGYPDLAPLTLPMASDQAFDRALAVAQEKGWDIVTADKATGRIEATDTTTWFGFKDDVVVRLTPWGSGTRVDVRSVSRVGRSDVGTNAARIEDFLDSLQG